MAGSSKTTGKKKRLKIKINFTKKNIFTLRYGKYHPITSHDFIQGYFERVRVRDGENWIFDSSLYDVCLLYSFWKIINLSLELHKNRLVQSRYHHYTECLIWKVDLFILTKHPISVRKYLEIISPSRVLKFYNVAGHRVI